MATIIRRNKPDAAPAPVTIKRRREEPVFADGRPADYKGAGWPDALSPGYPVDAEKKQHHIIEIGGVKFAFMWNPLLRGDPMWTCGLHNWSPSIMSRYDYHGTCVLVYRSPTTPDINQTFKRGGRR